MMNRNCIYRRSTGKTLLKLLVIPWMFLLAAYASTSTGFLFLQTISLFPFPVLFLKRAVRAALMTCAAACVFLFVEAVYEQYEITEEGIYVNRGIFQRRTVCILWTQMPALTLYRDPIDTALHLSTGTIRADCATSQCSLRLADIPDCEAVYADIISLRSSCGG